MSDSSLGPRGEAIALQHLLHKGYTLLETNWRSGRQEVDIIVEFNEVVVFVEVKTRNSNFFGEPAEWVTATKQRHLIKAADNFMRDRDLDKEARFDVIGVILNQHKEQIQHIENAFTPRW